MTAAADYARAFSTLSDRLVAVLDEGDLDSASREELSHLSRWSSGVAASLTVQPELQAPTEEESERAWFYSWYNHVGAVPTLSRGLLGPRWAETLTDAGLVWADEIDPMSDKELLGIRRVGPKTLAKIRETLDAYLLAK